MNKRKYSLGFLSLKEEVCLFKKLDNQGILYEYDHIKNEKPLSVDYSNLNEDDAIALEEVLLEDFGAQYMGEVEEEKTPEPSIEDNEQEKNVVEEDIDSLITEALGDGDYAIVFADWKDTDGLIESAKKAFQQFGLVITEDPTIEDSDSVGFIVSKRTLTDKEIKEISYAGIDFDDDEGEISEIE